MKNKKMSTSKSAINKFLKGAITEAVKPSETEANQNRLPDEFVRQMIHHADKYTSKRIRMHIWENNWNGNFKTVKELIKELKEFIPKEKHKEWLEFTEVLQKAFNLK